MIDVILLQIVEFILCRFWVCANWSINQVVDGCKL